LALTIRNHAHALSRRKLETAIDLFLLTVCARFVWDIVCP
jgi:hypothetical protein